MENHPNNLRLNDANRKINQSVQRHLTRVVPGSEEWLESQIAQNPNSKLAKLCKKIDEPNWNGWRDEWVLKIENGWKAQAKTGNIPAEVLEINQELENHFNGHSQYDFSHSHHYVIYQLVTAALKTDKIELSYRALGTLVKNLHERLYQAKNGVSKGFSLTVCREATQHFRIRYFSKSIAQEKAKLRFSNGTVRFKYGSTWKLILMMERCDEQWREWHVYTFYIFL